jgi:hypothetical protein
LKLVHGYHSSGKTETHLKFSLFELLHFESSHIENLYRKYEHTPVLHQRPSIKTTKFIKFHNTMPVCENETAMSQGRIPTYMRRSLTDFVAVLLRLDFRSGRLSNMLLQNCSLGSSFSVIMLLHCSGSRQRELLQQFASSALVLILLTVCS